MTKTKKEAVKISDNELERVNGGIGTYSAPKEVGYAFKILMLQDSIYKIAKVLGYKNDLDGYEYSIDLYTNGALSKENACVLTDYEIDNNYEEELGTVTLR